MYNTQPITNASVTISTLALPLDVSATITRYCEFPDQLALRRTSRGFAHAVHRVIAQNAISGRTLHNLESHSQPSLTEALFTLLIRDHLVTHADEEALRSFRYNLFSGINRIFFPHVRLYHNGKKRVPRVSYDLILDEDHILLYQTLTQSFLKVAGRVLLCSQFSHKAHYEVLKLFLCIKKAHDYTRDDDHHGPFAVTCRNSALLLVRANRDEELPDKTQVTAYKLIRDYNDSINENPGIDFPTHPFVANAYQILEPEETAE